MSLKSLAFLSLAVSLTLGCASQRPVLYPNARLQQSGLEQAALDTETCIDWAEEWGADNDRHTELARRTGENAAAGGATGAVVGAIRGSHGRYGAGRTAAAGAAGAATWTLVRGALRADEPAPIHRAFVERCLRDQGYATIGWK